LGNRPQEAYRWPLVAQASRYAIDIRYRALDYLYTAFYAQTQTGKPVLNPLFYIYPEDSKTFGIDGQYFFGDSIMISPVLAENKTSVSIYVPKDIFYDWNAGFRPVQGNGSMVNLTNVNFTTIPLHVRGGAIIPLRVASANTTSQLRKKGFHILIAPGMDGSANGTLYADDGISLVQSSTTFINFTYAKGGAFSMSGDYSHPVNVSIEKITVANIATAPQSINITAAPQSNFTYDNVAKTVTINTDLPFTHDVSFNLPSS
jgi:alpha-glucosidase